ncbi:hypothetical protein OAT67_01800 [Bacteriovoracaceae bacterium]|nr:hypothetical protein [Bacteriovoracaceae bacterium]
MKNKFQKYLDDEDEDFTIVYSRKVTELSIPSKTDEIEILYRLHIISLYLHDDMFNGLWALWKNGYDKKIYENIYSSIHSKLDDFDRTISFMFYMESLVRKESYFHYLENRNLPIDFMRGKMNHSLCFLPCDYDGNLVKGASDLSKDINIVSLREGLYSEAFDGLLRMRAKLAVHELLLCFKLQVEPLKYLLSHSLGYLKSEFLNKELDLAFHNVTREEGLDPSFVQSVLDGVKNSNKKTKRLHTSPQQVSEFQYSLEDIIDKNSRGDTVDSEKVKNIFGLSLEDLSLEGLSRIGAVKKLTPKKKSYEILEEKLGINEELIKSYCNTITAKNNEIKSKSKMIKLRESNSVLMDFGDFISNFLHLPYEFGFDVLISDIVREDYFLLNSLYHPSIGLIPDCLVEALSQYQNEFKIND